MRAVGNRIIVKPLPEDKNVGNGFMLQQGFQPPKKGIVIQVGPDTKSVHINDTVFFPKNMGAEINVSGEVYRVMTESDILAIL